MKLESTSIRRTGLAERMVGVFLARDMEMNEIQHRRDFGAGIYAL